MTCQAKMLMVTYLLIICHASDGRKGTNPAKRSGIAISSILDNLVMDGKSDIASSNSVKRMFLPDASDTRKQDLDLFNFLRQHQDSSPQPKSRRTPTNHITKALVDVTVCNDHTNADCELRIDGIFGRHSPHKTVSGHLIHIRDMQRADVHHGCSGILADIPTNMDSWIALIARGTCTFTKKIKIAEKYNASAVIIYNTKKVEELHVMSTRGK